ncbi:transcription factor bHLH125 [Populus alba x Populus x berolinensis]|uniref:Transcription factor bHLH125 n=1 Tax=Populus alba x Populus x berolinensis TaxID=444605 RepID=A0AAD6WFT8_9ROSI|nr:transcription factor bHLH125 [Populus alba x Populus x berolinensis]
MDYISSVFQIDYNSTDDLDQYFSSFPSQQLTTPKDKAPLRPYEDCHELANKTQHGRRRKSPIALGSIQDENPDDNKKKKIIHRDIERQRRQEMANLYGFLRRLLPLKYLKVSFCS